MSNSWDGDDVFTIYDKTGDEYVVQRTPAGFQLEDGTPVEQLDGASFQIKTNPPIDASIEHYIDTELDEED